jgi:ubiquinone/menaquinone biosynthesis C-methylase UbiE
MDPRLQQRVQRYGWDLAASSYESLWQKQIAIAHVNLVEAIRLAAGERVLDVACGTGLVSFVAAEAVGADGRVLGIDLSGEMVESAARRRRSRDAANATFERMDAELLDLPDASFDVALCSLGLMYLPDPQKALREMTRVLRPADESALLSGANGRGAAGRPCSRSSRRK